MCCSKRRNAAAWAAANNQPQGSYAPQPFRTPWFRRRGGCCGSRRNDINLVAPPPTNQVVAATTAAAPYSDAKHHPQFSGGVDGLVPSQAHGPPPAYEKVVEA